jgi:hypothetical protein
VKAGRSIRLELTIVPRSGTRVSDLYVGIAGPGSWGDEGSVPTGDYLILAHDKATFTGARRFTATWNPAAPIRTGPVYLSVLYTAADRIGPQLNETTPVMFRVS